MAEAMASIIEGMERKTIDEFIVKANANDPVLKKTEVAPKALVQIGKDATGNAVVTSSRDIADMPGIRMQKGDSICIDFGDHYVGHVTLKLSSTGSPQDAPAFLRFKFAEIPQEILDDSNTYEGWISKGWIQEEYVHIDVLPETLAMPRRYSFRYMEVLVIDASVKFQVVVDSAVLTAESAVSMEDVAPVEGLPEDLQKIDRAALKTLQDCMQHVFEDGPKRDRRLWIGDLRLQAKTNYYTFKNYELVRRCMYLFAGLTRADGKIGACLFTEPVMQVDDTFLWDYALFFVSILYDYYNETKDIETVKELWPAGYRQIELALDDMRDGVLRTDQPFTAFIDWKDGLDRQAAAQGVWVYVLRQGSFLADIAGTPEQKAKIEELLADGKEKAVSCFWNNEKKLFESGHDRQISKISQAWMVLGDVVDIETGRDLMLRTVEMDEALDVLTPYAYHCLVEALLHVGEKDKALEMLRSYWGAMVDLGADTFWEAFDPDDPLASPYGNMQVNSFCHAWSCTPSWLFREYFS